MILKNFTEVAKKIKEIVRIKNFILEERRKDLLVGELSRNINSDLLIFLQIITIKRPIITLLYILEKNPLLFK